MASGTLTFPDGAVLLEPEETAQTPATPGAGPNYVDAGERRLIRAIRKGDERAFARLVHGYQDRVYGLCLRMLRRPDEAEDVAQEVFVSLHRGLSSFRAESKLSTWIYRITRNHCLNRLKYLERRHDDAQAPLDSVSEAGLAEAAGHRPTRPDQHLEGRELRGRLERALGELGEEQRLLVLLRDVEGLSYEEIVEVCELPLGTVKSRLHRARLALATRLRQWQEAEGQEASASPAVATETR
jgi:RNA polymerase sigma-70 factor, ECF subfamily